MLFAESGVQDTGAIVSVAGALVTMVLAAVNNWINKRHDVDMVLLRRDVAELTVRSTACEEREKVQQIQAMAQQMEIEKLRKRMDIHSAQSARLDPTDPESI